MIGSQAKAGIHIHICDDHELITESVTQLLRGMPNIDKISVSHKKMAFFEFLNNNNSINAILLDINLKGENMLNSLPVIRKLRPETRVVILSTYDSHPIIKEAIDLGVSGFVSKNSNKEELTFCVQQVLEGKRYISREQRKDFVFRDNFELLKLLTDREIEVLKCLTKGYTNKAIADELSISILTVQTHRKNMYSKLNLRGVNELVSFAYENNLYG